MGNKLHIESMNTFPHFYLNDQGLWRLNYDANNQASMSTPSHYLHHIYI